MLNKKRKKLVELKEKIIPILKENDVAHAGIFGSVARGKMRKGSDIDLLVKFRGRKTLFDLARLELKLEKCLKKRVDVLTYNSINPLLRDRILKQEVKIL